MFMFIFMSSHLMARWWRSRPCLCQTFAVFGRQSHGLRHRETRTWGSSLVPAMASWWKNGRIFGLSFGLGLDGLATVVGWSNQILVAFVRIVESATVEVSLGLKFDSHVFVNVAWKATTWTVQLAKNGGKNHYTESDGDIKTQPRSLVFFQTRQKWACDWIAK